MIDLDTESLYDLAAKGLTQKEIAEEMEVSVPTLSKKIAEIQSKQGILMKYRALQSLQLTELQARVLEAITPEKIEDAPLRDLVVAYKILKDKELVVEGKPSDIKGLVGFLVALEKEEAALNSPEAVDAEFEEMEKTTRDLADSDYVPEL
jgi:transcriptional regulator with XRE-family HTH domain